MAPAATKSKIVLRVSCFFENGQGKHFDLDPSKDKLDETVKHLVITRGDATKAKITINRDKMCFYVVSREKIEADPSKHPAFQNPDSEDIEFR